MGVTLLVLAIIAIVVGVSVKEYFQNKAAEEEKEKAPVQPVTPEPVIAPELTVLTSNDVQELLKEVEKIAEVKEEPKKPAKKKYYKPKGKKQPKKQTK